MSAKPRHEQLLDAGWVYDPSQDRYRQPNSASDGTARLYNQAAAWDAYQADLLDSANQPPQPPTRVARKSDPRKREPE